MRDASGESSCAAFPSTTRLSAHRRESSAAAVLKTIRGCAALGENVAFRKSADALCAGQSRPEPHMGFFALSLHNARRISFWVYDKSHVGAVVNSPRRALQLSICLAGTSRLGRSPLRAQKMTSSAAPELTTCIRERARDPIPRLRSTRLLGIPIELRTIQRRGGGVVL